MGGPSASCRVNSEQLQGRSMNDLPEELLVRIMSYLSLFQRKRLREVSKYWNSISYERSLIKVDWMVVPTVRDLAKLEDRPPERKFINLRIRDVNDDFSNSCVWQKFGPFIQNVELYVNDITNPVFASIFKYCNNLKSLVIINYFGYTKRVTFAQSMSNDALSTLTSITLCDLNGDLTDAEFNSLTSNSLRLTKVCLEACPSLNFVNVKNLLMRQSSLLTHLELSRISEVILLDLLSCVGKQLISLELSSSTHSLANDILIKICELFPNLEAFTLSEADFIDEGARTAFCTLKKLKSIDIYNTKLTDFPLMDMFRLDDLTDLRLSSCNGITGDGLVAAFTQRPLPKLETLNLNALYSVNDQLIWAISPMIPNVRWLDLNHTDITAFGVKALICYNKKLRFLSLMDCSDLNDMFTDTPSINDLEELRELKLCFNPGMDESSIQCLSLKELRKLKLRQSGSNVNTDLPSWPKSSFATLIERCPSLEVVDMPSDIYSEEIDTSDLSPRAKKILPLPCHCGFSPKKHRTQICQA